MKHLLFILSLVTTVITSAQNIIVADGSDQMYNGTYIPDGTYNGRPKYVLSTDNTRTMQIPTPGSTVRQGNQPVRQSRSSMQLKMVHTP